MSGKFDPSALMSLGSSLGDDAEVVAVGEEELRRIAGADVRRKCAGIKLAARLVGMATVGRDELDERVLLRQMHAMMTRMGALRKAALEAMDIDRSSPDFPVAFNVATNAVMDVLTEEWKWSRLGGDAAELGPDALRKLLELSVNEGPLYIDVVDSGDLKTARRLCVLESLPKLWTVVNMFDYYQPSREKLVAQLARAVSEQAERHAGLLYSDASPTFAVRAIVQRMYGVSSGLMSEVYKDTAARDVAKLRALPDLDRSVVMTQYESTGMVYEHIIQRHAAVMDRTLDTTKLILEAQTAPARTSEQNYDA